MESVYNDNQQTVCVHFSVCDLVKPYMPKAVGASIEPTSWQDLVSQLIGCLKMMKEIKGIIFDKDGTLFDIQRSWSEGQSLCYKVQ